MRTTNMAISAHLTLAVVFLAAFSAALPGPSDVSNTYLQSPPFSYTLDLLKRQFTGGASVPFSGPPADKCYHRNDTQKACPYGGQCRPDLGFTCETYCRNYGKDLNENFSCNLPCSYAATNLTGEMPKNPLHCAQPSAKSPLKDCESGWACYRQFTSDAPAFEQPPPVCSPRYDECELPPLPEEAMPAAASNTTFTPSLSANNMTEPVVSLGDAAGSPPSTDSPASTETNSESTTEATASPASAMKEENAAEGEGDVTITSEITVERLWRRQSSPQSTCSTGSICIQDPRPALGLPPNTKTRRGICVKVEEARRCDQRVWNSCGEKGHCARDSSVSTSGLAAAVGNGAMMAGKRVKSRREVDEENALGFCVPVLGEDWKSSGSAIPTTKQKRGGSGSLRPMC